MASDGNKPQNPWDWLTKTWIGPVFSLIALASAPLTFVAERGYVWFLFIVVVATWCWWATHVFRGRQPNLIAPGTRLRYRWWQITLWALVPLVFTSFFLFALVSDIERLNIWRQDYRETVVLSKRFGPVNNFYGDTGPRATPEEREDYERAEWIRWMESGARQETAKPDLLFIETEPFEKRYHTFSLEVHDLGKQVRPFRTGVAFLVQARRGDPWKRVVLRQVPCDLVADANTRLFRILVENPDPGEFLWLFLRVTSGKNVDLTGLNLHLKVR